MRNFIIVFWALFLVGCHENSDSTTIEDIPLNPEEHFEFTLNGFDYYIKDIESWIENHDSLYVTQILNFHSGELPQFIFNIHGTSTGMFNRADITILLDENQTNIDFFECKGCPFTISIDYFGDRGDYVIGTFEGNVPFNQTWYPIEGKFATIREN